jgi:hypothetical protein
MSQAPHDSCISCKRPWNEVTQACRARAFKEFKKGDVLPRCEGCQIKSNHTENRKKRKIDNNDDSDHDAEPQQLNGQAGLEEALGTLAFQPGWTSFKAMLSDFQSNTEDMTSCAVRVAAIVADCTGYKFSYVCPQSSGV